MDYFVGEPFLQITFPSRGIEIACVRHKDIKRIIQTTEDGKPVVKIRFDESCGDLMWTFDGTMEDFKKACETIRL